MAPSCAPGSVIWRLYRFYILHFSVSVSHSVLVQHQQARAETVAYFLHYFYKDKMQIGQLKPNNQKKKKRIFYRLVLCHTGLIQLWHACGKREGNDWALWEVWSLFMYLASWRIKRSQSVMGVRSCQHLHRKCKSERVCTIWVMVEL